MITSKKFSNKKRKIKSSLNSSDSSNKIDTKISSVDDRGDSRSEEISRKKKRRTSSAPPPDAKSPVKPDKNSPKDISRKRKKPKFLVQNIEPVKFEEPSVCTNDTRPQEPRIAPLKTSGFCWGADAKLLAQVIEPTHASDSSEDEDDSVSKKKKKRQTVAEKRDAAKKEEERLRAIEESLASNSNLPSSCDEFDRALLSNPDSSELWLQYMAFHLQATEIDKARAVAQRALKTISYRKEQEKLNIWVGLLNLENLYGTQETLKKTLTEALQLNDAYKVRVQMVNIYSENGKLQELESEVKLVVKKFRDVKGMWLEIGTILYKHGHIEHARRLLQQGLSAQRNKNETVSLISRFAMMEAKFGEMERALALFDSILASHPQRVDVWSVCIDQLCKAGMINQARSTLERAISQKLKSRWMKILFAKYLTFEEKYGTAEGCERVREKAREYVERVSGEKLEG